MIGPYVWHINGAPWAPRRCRHRVLAEAGPFLIVAARCGKGLPDAAEPWPAGVEPKVRQIPRASVDAPHGRHPALDWFSAAPPLPPKAPRPSRLEPQATESPWTFEVLPSFEPAAADVAALSLTRPFTEADVRAAFRRKAKVAHPDGGGSSEAFTALRAAHDRLLQSVTLRRAS